MIPPHAPKSAAAPAAPLAPPRPKTPARAAFATALAASASPARPIALSHPQARPPVEPAAARTREVEVEAKRAPAVREEIVDPLDPSARRAAMLAPLTTAGVGQAVAPLESPSTAAPSPRLSLEELVPQLVRRIAWGGDKRRGSVQLELGAGAYAGSTITVHADEGRLRLEVRGGADADGLREKLDARLRRHGLAVESD